MSAEWIDAIETRLAELDADALGFDTRVRGSFALNAPYDLRRLLRVARAAEALLAADVEAIEYDAAIGRVRVSPSADAVAGAEERLRAALEGYDG